MACSATSENRFAALLFNAATVATLEVVRVGVWHSAQPMSLNFCLPRLIDADDAPRNEVTGFG
jgi:hypothetical protein